MSVRVHPGELNNQKSWPCYSVQFCLFVLMPYGTALQKQSTVVIGPNQAEKGAACCILEQCLNWLSF